MAKSKKAGFDESLFGSRLKCRAASPWGRKLDCLDVLTSVQSDKGALLSKFICGGSSISRGLTSTNVKPTSALVKQASMFDPEWMTKDSKWHDAEYRKSFAGLKGFADLKNLRKPSVEGSKFQKRSLERLELAWNTSKGVSAWLMDIAGMDVGKDETLNGTVDGLVVASVDMNLIRNWVGSVDAEGALEWHPNVAVFQRNSSDWEKSHDKSEDGIVKSLWIIAEVIYATKITVTGQNEVFASAKAQVVTGVPGVDPTVDVAVEKVSNSRMMVKAARNSHFIVGYRVMRLDYNVRDGKLVKTRVPEESHLRGHDDDDPQLRDLEKEDVFEVDDESGELVPIPILALSEKELNELIMNKADHSTKS